MESDGSNPGLDWVSLVKSGTLDLRGADLRGAELDGINLEKAYLSGANLSGANLQGATLSKSWAGASKHRRSNAYAMGLPVSDRWGLRGEEYPPFEESADFSDANLRGANFFLAEVEGVKFCGADLTGSDFSNADLHRADFSGAILVNAHGICLDRTNLMGASLVGNDFGYGKNGLWWNLAGENNMRGADLSGSNLSELGIGGLDLTLANLEGANLEGITGDDFGTCRLHGANISNAIVDNPEEFLKRGARYL